MPSPETRILVLEILHSSDVIAVHYFSQHCGAVWAKSSSIGGVWLTGHFGPRSQDTSVLGPKCPETFRIHETLRTLKTFRTHTWAKSSSLGGVWLTGHFGPRTLRNRDTLHPGPKCLETLQRSEVSRDTSDQGQSVPIHFGPGSEVSRDISDPLFKVRNFLGPKCPGSEVSGTRRVSV